MNWEKDSYVMNLESRMLRARKILREILTFPEIDNKGKWEEVFKLLGGEF